MYRVIIDAIPRRHTKEIIIKVLMVDMGAHKDQDSFMFVLVSCMYDEKDMIINSPIRCFFGFEDVPEEHHVVPIYPPKHHHNNNNLFP